MKKKSALTVILVVISIVVTSLTLDAEYHPMKPQPIVVYTPAGKAPSDAIVLFDGTNLSEWSGTDGKPSKWIV